MNPMHRIGELIIQRIGDAIVGPWQSNNSNLQQYKFSDGVVSGEYVNILGGTVSHPQHRELELVPGLYRWYGCHYHNTFRPRALPVLEWNRRCEESEKILFKGKERKTGWVGFVIRTNFNSPFDVSKSIFFNKTKKAAIGMVRCFLSENRHNIWAFHA